MSKKNHNPHVESENPPVIQERSSAELHRKVIDDRFAYDALAKEASQFDSFTRRMLFEHDQSKKKLIETRRIERDTLLAKKLGAYKALNASLLAADEADEADSARAEV